jgi:hypothetical protein
VFRCATRPPRATRATSNGRALAASRDQPQQSLPRIWDVALRHRRVRRHHEPRQEREEPHPRPVARLDGRLLPHRLERSRAENYDLVTRNKRTGKELKRESHTDTHDDYKSALFDDASKKLAERVKAELGVAGID